MKKDMLSINSFSEAVKVARVNLNHSIRDLSKLTGISPTHICDMEHGRKSASDVSLEALTEALGYSPGFLWALCGRVHPRVGRKLVLYPEKGEELYRWSEVVKE